MATGDDYVEHLLDLLAPIGRCTARRMFGGTGIFLDAAMLGLVYDGRFYLKVDDETRARFEAEGGEPFVYQAPGKKMEMSYLSPPDLAFDSPAEMSPWARLAAQAAGRAAYGKRGKAGKVAPTEKRPAPSTPRPAAKGPRPAAKGPRPVAKGPRSAAKGPRPAEKGPRAATRTARPARRD